MNHAEQVLICGERHTDGATLRHQADQAVSRLGAHLVAVNWHFQPTEAGYLLHDCGAKVLVIHADLLPLGSMLYTAGTTGRPKGGMRLPGTPGLRVRALVGKARAGMRKAIVGPLYHASPNSSARLALEMAERVIVMPRFDAEALLQTIEQHRLTHLALVPVMLVRLLKLAPELRSRYDTSWSM